MEYTGTSIVEYLKSLGQPSDFSTRSTIAKQKGITNYSGTTEQNIQLLNMLRTPQQVAPGVQQPIQQSQQPIQTGQVNPTTSQPTNMVQVSPEQYQQTQELNTKTNELLGTNIDATPTVEQPTDNGVTDELSIEEKNPVTSMLDASSGSSNGFDDLFSQFGLSTKNTMEDVVKTVSQMYGFEDIGKEMTKLDDQYADDVMEVNDNPWLSEGSRSKRVGLLKDKYDTKKNAYIEQLRLRGDIVGKAVELYQNEKDLQKDLLYKAIELRQQEIENQKQEAVKGFELSQGQSRYEYNPETGQYEVVASVAPKADAKSVTDAKDQLYSGLSSSTGTAVRAKVSKFSSEPIIQNFATIQEGYNFASSLSDTTKNPADDQALIYSLAKALDPGSVVREGEYATAQKYAQSWVNAYGKSITQALLGTGFLSREARENIKKTISSKYNSSKKSYENLYKNYTTGINNLTGRTDGEKFITDYVTPTTGNELTINNLPPTDEQSSEDDGFWGNILNMFK